MTTSIVLSESAKVPYRKVGTKWRVTVATPGQGSSGKYSEDMLRERGPAAFPAGTRAFFNHDAKRDLRDLVGTYPEGAFWNEEEGLLQADLVALPRWSELLDDLESLAATSIHAQGDRDAQGNITLNYDRGNTIDLVGLPGLEGSGVKYRIESLFNEGINDPDAETSAQNERKARMEKEIADLTAQVAELRTTLTAFVSESKAAVQGKADEDAVNTAVSEKLAERHEAFLVVKEQIAEAKLLPSQVKALEAKALTGADIAEDLKNAKALVEEAHGIVAEGGSVIVGEALKTDNSKFTVTGWGNN